MELRSSKVSRSSRSRGRLTKDHETHAHTKKTRSNHALILSLSLKRNCRIILTCFAPSTHTSVFSALSSILNVTNLIFPVRTLSNAGLQCSFGTTPEDIFYVLSLSRACRRFRALLGLGLFSILCRAFVYSARANVFFFSLYVFRVSQP